jgi:hypothetical protein
MKVTVLRPTEIEITHIRVELPVRYEEDDIPNDFPLRGKDWWMAKIEIDTGKIEGWPIRESGYLHMKVCDEGTYKLFDEKGFTVATIEQNYVPHGVIPGEYGDYVELKINEQGIITNWPKKPDVSAFFRKEEE